MNDRTLPWWLKALLIVSALAQAGFGLTLLFNPAAIAQLWPWHLSPISARLLGASTLVSVPMALLSVFFNRWTAARIPLVMIISYRVLQLTAGLIHIQKFNLASMTAINYFGGGTIMLLGIAVALARGPWLGRPADSGQAWLRGNATVLILRPVKITFVVIGVIYFTVGLAFLIIGENGAFMWFEASGLTGLTARLFASPAMGLALGMWLIIRAQQWRQVAIPAVGMATFGISGALAMSLSLAEIVPPTALGYLIPITPLVLLGMGLYLLFTAPTGADTALA